jgi:hypothetical protein
MTPASFNKAFKIASQRRPFQPYVLEFDSGPRLEVRHPEAIALFKTLIIFRSVSAEYSFFDCTNVSRMISVTVAG